jgi:hypothetical protein
MLAPSKADEREVAVAEGGLTRRKSLQAQISGKTSDVCSHKLGCCIFNNSFCVTSVIN